MALAEGGRVIESTKGMKEHTREWDKYEGDGKKEIQLVKNEQKTKY